MHPRPLPLILLLIAAGACSSEGTLPDVRDAGDDDDDPGEPYDTAPGLEIELLGATLADGEATATVWLTDGDDVPLDREGRLTRGAVDLRFVLAYLPLDAAGDPDEYVAF